MTAPHTTPFNAKAAAWTIGIHVLLLLLFALWKYRLPAEPVAVQEAGIEVNLGTSDEGFGKSQPQDPEAPAAMASQMARASGGATAMQDMMREDNDNNPAVSTAANAVKTTASATTGKKQTTAPAAQTQSANTAQQQRPRYVYPGATGKGGNGAMALAPGGAEGNTHGAGDRGVPNGTPGASNYTGNPGHGTGGIGFSLGGRTIVSYPPRDAEFREGGKVIVRVTVNRSGNIVSSEISSSTNSELNNIALRKVRNVRFNKSEDAPQEQFGTITFVFRAGQ